MSQSTSNLSRMSIKSLVHAPSYGGKNSHSKNKSKFAKKKSKENTVTLASSVEFLNNLFKTYDVDGNGSISYGELHHMLESLGMQHDIWLAYAELDHDGDGEISFKEFSDWWISYKGLEQPNEKK